MKYSISIFLIVNSIFISCYSQDNSSRILDIKKMYGEVNKLSNANTSKQCKTGTNTSYEGFDENSEQVPFEQTAELCHISKEYSTYRAKFCGYEWASETIFYLKNNKIFFVFQSTGAESCSDEYRAYYDINGKIIKILNKSNECNGDTPSISSEIKDKEEMKRIQIDINSDFSKVVEMIK